MVTSVNWVGNKNHVDSLSVALGKKKLHVRFSRSKKSRGQKAGKLSGWFFFCLGTGSLAIKISFFAWAVWQ